MSCQMGASKSCELFHVDLKTAFLQEQSFDVNRDVVCQLPPEAGSSTMYREVALLGRVGMSGHFF